MVSPARRVTPCGVFHVSASGCVRLLIATSIAPPLYGGRRGEPRTTKIGPFDGLIGGPRREDERASSPSAVAQSVLCNSPAVRLIGALSASTASRRTTAMAASKMMAPAVGVIRSSTRHATARIPIRRILA